MPLSPSFSDDLELQHLQDILPEDLYTDSLIVRTINHISSNKRKLFEDNVLSRCSKNIHLLLSPECLQNIIILRNPTPQTMHLEEKAVALIIPRVNPPPSQSNNLISLQQLSIQWDNSLHLNEQPSTTPPMIFLLWNCWGIKNQGFKMHFKELLTYHKPAIAILT